MRPKNAKQAKLKRSQGEAAEIKRLEALIAEGAPPKAGEVNEAQSEGGYSLARKFADLPLSDYTKEGLKEAKFVQLTAIQRFALPQALCGRDVFGAAKTGSGKTLAFLIPVIEKLYRLQWGALDGLGALVISPTRELALQIFNELRKVGKKHEFSAGLLIGGKNVKEEQERVGGMNILICTPGRLLQHMDETPNFDASNIHILVLDEADRILDMGFSATVDAIVENLPKQRQTLLFSATQKQSVKQLARLSLKDPQYVSVHENAEAPTPAKLEQAYAMCELQDKLGIVWSFIRSHLKAKILVFASTCKQVKFLYDAFSRLRPGCPLRSLHGGMKQMRRMSVFYDFCESSTGMVLFATDIAARGLDFAKLDWVLQMDCPEDVPAYIHRVGRTARYVSAGRGLLLLTPSERAFVDQLAEAKVPIKAIKINPDKTQPITPALQAILSKSQDLKEAAQRCMTAYLRSVFLAPNKAVFDVRALPTQEYALSMGLSAPPKLRFIKKGGKSAQEVSIGGSALEEEEGPQAREATGTTPRGGEGGSDGASPPAADELLRLKRSSDDAELGEAAPEQAPPAKKKKKPLRIPEGAGGTGSRVVFDDDGVGVDTFAALAKDDFGEEGTSMGHRSAAERFKAAAAVLRERDVEDRKEYQQRKRSKAAEAKAKRRARETEEGAAVTLGPGLGYPGEEHFQDTSGDSSDGQDDARDTPPRRLIPEKSHFGMSVRKDRPLTVAEQESLALKLLSGS